MAWSEQEPCSSEYKRLSSDTLCVLNIGVDTHVLIINWKNYQKQYENSLLPEYTYHSVFSWAFAG